MASKEERIEQLDGVDLKETKAAPTPPMTAEEYNDMLLEDYYRDLYEGCRQPWDS